MMTALADGRFPWDVYTLALARIIPAMSSPCRAGSVIHGLPGVSLPAAIRTRRAPSRSIPWPIRRRYRPCCVTTPGWLRSGCRLAEMRKRRGMTQEQVAERMGVSVAPGLADRERDVSTQDVLKLAGLRCGSLQAMRMASIRWLRYQFVPSADSSPFQVNEPFVMSLKVQRLWVPSGSRPSRRTSSSTGRDSDSRRPGCSTPRLCPRCRRTGRTASAARATAGTAVRAQRNASKR
jgi:transcriptional regulator with XRE-family HTH domain